jgi:hypothetical protein
MIENLSGSLDVAIKVLKIPVLVLAAILLYRLDRIISSGLHSAQMLERTAENVAKSSKTFCNVTSLLNRIPGFGSEKKESKSREVDVEDE